MSPIADYLRILRNRLLARLEEQPFEDGMSHSAEEVVKEALYKSDKGKEAIKRLIEEKGTRDLFYAAFGAQYPACTFPCQRLEHVVTVVPP